MLALPAALRNALLLGAATFVLSTGAICGKGSAAKSTASPTPVSDEVFHARAEYAARRSLLSLQDFPEHWLSKPAEPDDDEDTPEEIQALESALSPGCLFVERALGGEEGYPSSVFESASDEFYFDLKLTEDVRSWVGVYRTVEALDRDWELALAEQDCFAELTEGIRRVYALDPELAQAVTRLELTRREVPTIGDGSLGFDLYIHATIDGREFDVTTSGVSIRVGRMAADLSWMDWGDFDEALADSLIAVIVDRLEKANQVLPE